MQKDSRILGPTLTQYARTSSPSQWFSCPPIVDRTLTQYARTSSPSQWFSCSASNSGPEKNSAWIALMAAKPASLMPCAPMIYEWTGDAFYCNRCPPM